MVRFNGRPVSVPDEEIENVRRFMEALARAGLDGPEPEWGRLVGILAAAAAAFAVGRLASGELWSGLPLRLALAFRLPLALSATPLLGESERRLLRSLLRGRLRPVAPPRSTPESGGSA